jgi:hypothetical protein
MRYFRGYLSISDDRDIPLLLQLRNARALSFNQLTELLLLEGSERVRRIVHWRTARLEKHGFITRVELDRFLGQPLLSITSAGLRLLESRGHFLLSLPSDTEQIIHPSQIQHAMELVNIRLAFARRMMLRSWLGELEIASRNMIQQTGNAKDYDAIAEILVDGEPQTVAIEYERTAKGAVRYDEIRRMLDRDRSVEAVLYVTSDRYVLHLLAQELHGVKKRVGIALADTLRRDLLDASTLVVERDVDVVPFRALLAHQLHS